MDLQALLENGTINPETFAALTGHSVNIIQESDLPEAQLEQDENGVVRIVQAAPIQQHQQQEVVDGDHGVLSQHGEEIKMSDLLGEAKFNLTFRKLVRYLKMPSSYCFY